MKTERTGLHTLITGDSLTSPVTTGSGVAWVNLDPGEAAKWTKGDPVTITGANAAEIREVQDVDTGGDRIQVTPDLPTAPSSGDTAQGGSAEFTRADLAHSGCFYSEPDTAPTESLTAALGTDHRTLVWFEMELQARIMEAATKQWIVHVVGVNPEWVEANAQRLANLLAGDEDMAVAGHDVMGVAVLEAPKQVQRPESLLHEQELTVRTDVAVAV